MKNSRALDSRLFVLLSIGVAVAVASIVEKDVTIVFCDIRDSTKLGETLPSATIEDLLKRYFVAGEEAAVRLGTELDKFVGDEIMLFFEDRPCFEDHAIRGVRWALAIQDAARRITASGLAGDIGFRVGVGVCTGSARVGLVGAKQRIQHTVVGDAVNTASCACAGGRLRLRARKSTTTRQSKCGM